MDDLVKRLRALVIMDEVQSDNSLGREAADEIERLRAGGCARDQKTTQFCAEAAALSTELAALKEAHEITQKAWSDAVRINDYMRGRLSDMADDLAKLRARLSDAV